VEPGFDVPKAALVEPLLTEPLALITRDRTDRGIEVDPMVELDSLETIAILVGEGLGVSLVPCWRGLERFAPRLHVSQPLPAEYDRRRCLIYPNKNRNDPLWSAFRGLVSDCAAILGADRHRDVG
tara:strand:- start:303 stop:677 length:375 start_codon:yes stop_codon:yes gene_type:complete